LTKIGKDWPEFGNEEQGDCEQLPSSRTTGSAAKDLVRPARHRHVELLRADERIFLLSLLYELTIRSQPAARRQRESHHFVQDDG